MAPWRTTEIAPRHFGVMMAASALLVGGCAAVQRAPTVMSREPASQTGPTEGEPSRLAQPAAALAPLSLDNAAQRDREIGQLIGDYVRLTRRVFELVNRPRRGSSKGARRYDPTPAWALQAAQLDDLRRIEARAEHLVRHLTDLAIHDPHGIRAQGGPSARIMRIALYTSIFRCIGKDASARTDHAARFSSRPSDGQAGIDAGESIAIWAKERSLMDETVRCIDLITMRDMPLPPRHPDRPSRGRSKP